MLKIQLLLKMKMFVRDVLQTIFYVLEPTRRDVSEVFPTPPNLTLLDVLIEERSQRQALSVLCQKEGAKKGQHKEPTISSILEQEQAVQVLLEHNYYGGISELLVQQMKEEGTVCNTHEGTYYKQTNVIALFCSDLLQDSPYNYLCDDICPNDSAHGILRSAA